MQRIAPLKKMEIACGEKVWFLLMGRGALCSECKRQGSHQDSCTNKVVIDLSPKY